MCNYFRNLTLVHVSSKKAHFLRRYMHQRRKSANFLETSTLVDVSSKKVHFLRRYMHQRRSF